MDNIIIAGRKIRLEKPTQDITRRLWLGLLAEFELFQFAMNNYRLLLLVAKESVSYSPMQRGIIAHRIEEAVQFPAVFYFDNLPTYERDRLVDKGVYFVVSNKFAFIPTLLANRRLSKVEMPSQLLPSTQYLLMLHLQRCSLNGMTINEIEKISPYKYATLAKSAQQLTALSLATFKTDSGRCKQLVFIDNNRELWKKSLPYTANPIKHAGYIDEPLNNGLIGGIDALSHYSMLSGENIPTRVFTTYDKYPELKLSGTEDIQRVEIWKYPPIAGNGYVDRLSLYLTLRDDPDPRVEKELETMINEMPW